MTLPTWVGEARETAFGKGRSHTYVEARNMTLHDRQLVGAAKSKARSASTGRQRRRASEIIDAAARVFAARGYHGTSTQDIADALGLRQASLYYYFGSKEAALGAVCEHGVDGFVEAAEVIVATSATPREKIGQLIAAHLAPTHDKRDYVRVFINERRYLPKAMRRRIGRRGRRLEGLFQGVIEAGIADGSFRADIDVRLSTLAILGMCNAVINWHPGEPNADPATVAGEFARFATSGLLAAPPRMRKRGARG